jgi:hypothetical protein
MSEQSLRYNTGKAELSYILDVMPALHDMVAVMEFGGKKYERNNWQKGFPREKLLDSMLRHIDAFYSGEDIDPESGLPHVGHILCNAAFLGYHFGSRSEYWNKKEGEEVEKEEPWNGPVDENTPSPDRAIILKKGDSYPMGITKAEMTSSMLSKILPKDNCSLKVGDKVLVKSFEYIKENPHSSVVFVAAMKSSCGKVFEVTEVLHHGDAYRVNDWSFLREWLEKVG